MTPQDRIPRGWWGTDLGSHRPCSGTYQLYPYESLPPLDESELRGEFQWLRPDSPALSADPFAEHRPVPTGADSSGLAAQLDGMGLALPPAFVRFMSSSEMQAHVPSCTACEWDLAETAVPNPVQPGAYLVRFLRDQQDVLLWYVNVTPTDAAVLCSPIPFDELDMSQRTDEVLANTWWVAPHFEHFVYRFWIENTIWFGLEDDHPRTPAEQAYLAHYAATA